MKRLIFPLILGCLVLNGFGEDLISLSPTLLHSNDGPAFVPAVRIVSSEKKEWEFDRPDRFLVAQYALASTLSTRPKSNGEKTSLDFRSGGQWDFDAIPKPAQIFPGTGASQPPTSGSGRFSRGLLWGSCGLELAGAFEGDEAMDNRQWTYGVRFDYTPPLQGTATNWWQPYVWADYRRISEISSVDSTKIGLPAQNYWRFGSEIYWQWALANWLDDGFLRNLKIIPGLQYYRSDDPVLKSNSLADARYYSLAIDYAVPRSVSWAKQISGIRLQIADGRIPPATKNRTTLSIALTLHWDKFFP